MKCKLDENIGRLGLELLETSGHDVMTVWDQDLRGIADEQLFEVCSAEGRALITLDRDFGQVPRFPPEKSAGIVVLEVGPKQPFEVFSTGSGIFWPFWRAVPWLARCGSLRRDACGFTSATTRNNLT